MLSRRVPESSEPNDWSRLLDERRRAGARLIDFTEANPTRVGLGGAGPHQLAALGAAEAVAYAPDPRGLRTARVAVAGYYASRDLAIDPDQVVLITSTSEAYAHLFRLLCDQG